MTVDPDQTLGALASINLDATIAADDRPPLANAPAPVIAEFERLRRMLGFSTKPELPVDGRYRIEKLLGRGGMGEVHLAYDERLERQVALKLVRVSFDNDPSVLQARLMREALALARVAHPNVVGIHDVGNHEGQTYLTMQFVPGLSLREWQEDPSRKRTELLDAYLQAAHGLAAAHACGVVHRDFKPDNVIVGADGLVRVLDFGIAAALQPDPPDERRSTIDDAGDSMSDGETASLVVPITSSATDSGPGLGARMTRTGSILGTLAYMSSEQLIGRRADERSDQFSFCVALWEAYTRERPYPGRNPGARLTDIKSGPINADKLPRWLRPILLRGLASAPNRRWPSMAELIAALERGRNRGRKLLLGIGLSLGIATASVGGWAMSPKPAPAETCDAFASEIDAVWGIERRAAVQAHAGVDAEAIGYAIATIDTLVASWKHGAEQLCRDGAAPSQGDLQRICMTDWLASFDRTVALLVERSDAETLARAPDLLARLVPPEGDYCALRPSPLVDGEVWSLAEQARTAVVLGDVEHSIELADAAIARASSLDERRYTADLATAHAARAEVAAFGGDFDRALVEFAVTEQQALGSGFYDVLLPTNVLWAKVLALSGSSDGTEPLARAESLLFARNLDEQDPRRAELLEARGLSERAQGNHREAIELHRRAQSLFTNAGQPTLAAKSLNNIGTNFQEIGEPMQAKQAYSEAAALLERAGLPPTYRHRIEIEYNLGLLAYKNIDQSEQRKGLAHFEFVVRHGTDAERLEVLPLLISLTYDLKEQAVALQWTERALAELEARPNARNAAVVPILLAAGITLANTGDPRGETLLHAAELRALELPLLAQSNVQQSWIRWLENIGRCDEALSRREAFIARMDEQSSDTLPIGYEAWREMGPTSLCK